MYCMYRYICLLCRYGEICGIRRDKEYILEHKTFKNYCEMKNEDCTTLSQGDKIEIIIISNTFAHLQQTAM